MIGTCPRNTPDTQPTPRIHPIRVRSVLVPSGALLLAAIVPAIPARTLEAQGASVLQGQVIADSSFEGIEGAHVELVELGRQLVTSRDGAYRFAGLPSGSFTVRVRAIGYSPRDVRLAMSGRDSVLRDFVLVRQRTVLPTVTVRDSGGLIPVNLVDFERRRALGHGRFVPPPEMEKQRNRKLSDVLKNIPGIRLKRLAQGGMAVASGRGTVSLERRPSGECYAAVYLDGVRIFMDAGNDTYRPGAMGSAAGAASTPLNIDEFHTAEIAAIEYYAGPAQVPPELNMTGSACGVLALWTRMR